MDFDIFVDWLYLQRLPGAVCPLICRYHAYALADRLLAPDFKKLLFDLIFEKIEEFYPNYKMVIFAFENLAEDDVLLHLLVDAQCINGGLKRKMNDNDKIYLPDLPKEFLLRVMQKLNDMANKDEEGGGDGDDEMDSDEEEQRLYRDDYVVHTPETEEDKAKEEMT